VHVRPERERREKRRDEPTEVPRALPEEVEAAVIVGTDNPAGFLDGPGVAKLS